MRCCARGSHVAPYPRAVRPQHQTPRPQYAPRIEARQRRLGIARDANVSTGHQHRSRSRALRIGQHTSRCFDLDHVGDATVQHEQVRHARDNATPDASAGAARISRWSTLHHTTP